MSIESYRRNLANRVTGPNLPLCFPSALEQISPNYSYKPSVYKNHLEFLDWYCSFSVKQRDSMIDEYEKEVENLVRPLGGLSLKDLKFSRANTEIGFLRTVRPLLADGWGVVVDVCHTGKRSVTHAVGLLPVGGETDHVTLVSTHVPASLQGIIDLRQLATHIALPTETYVQGYHPMNNANITALPPLD
jgi:hypothetical protein